MTEVINFAERKRLHDARRGRLVSGRLRFVLLPEGTLEIRELNQHDAEIQAWDVSRENTKLLIERLARQFRDIELREYRVLHPPPPPPPPPKWRRCRERPDNRVVFASDGITVLGCAVINGRRLRWNSIRCSRRQGHIGSHTNRNGDTWGLTSVPSGAST